MNLDFGTQSYRLRSLPLSAQRLVNCYLEAAPPKAKTFAAVVPAYGIKTIVTVGSGNIRGGIVVNGTLYVVVGQVLYRVAANTTVTALGAVPGGAYVDIAGDEQHLMLVTSLKGYYWNGTTVTEITDPDFPGAEWVDNIDGYFIVGKPDSGQFNISANRMPDTWDALDFASAERYPDNLVRGIVDHGEIILFGKASGEVWADTGASDFPLEQVPNGVFEVGLLSRYGVAKIDNTVCFVGHDGIVYRLDGYTPVRISSHAIEQAIEDSADKTCFALAWKEGGHSFFSFSFDVGTFVFDAATQLWHERDSYGFDRWRPLFILRCYDQWIAGDFYTNQLGVLDANTFTEWGETVRASATSPPVSQDNRRIAHHRLELVFEQGVGTITGQGTDPQVMLRWSDDGGRTWSNEHWRSMGKLGEYRRRCCWHRLGQARDRVYEYSITDPVRRTLILATTEAAPLGY